MEVVTALSSEKEKNMICVAFLKSVKHTDQYIKVRHFFQYGHRIKGYGLNF